MVIPPGNSNTWKKNGVPNNDQVNRRVDGSVTSVTKVDLRMLRPVEDMFELFGYGQIPKTTFVQFEAGRGSNDIMIT